MADTLRYCTIDDVRARKITDSDDEISRAILRSQDIIDRYCRRKFSSYAKTILIDGSGHECLFLEDYPIVSITSIRYKNSFYSTWQTVNLSDLDIDSEAGIITYHRAVFPYDIRNVEIVGVFGYEEVPERIREACILLACAGGGSSRPLLGGNPLRDPGLQNESAEGYSWTRRNPKGGGSPALSTGDGYIDTILADYRKQIMMSSVGSRDVPTEREAILRRAIGEE